MTRTKHVLSLFTFAVALSQASFAHAQAAPATPPTPLHTLDIEPGHVIEFHQLPTGQTAIHERTMNGKTVVPSTLHDGQISLANVYKQLRPLTAVPQELVQADAVYAALRVSPTTAAAHATAPPPLHPATPAMSSPLATPEGVAGIIGSTGPCLENCPDYQFNAFRANVCDQYDTNLCQKGTDFVSTSQYLPVQYWGSWGFVPASSPVDEPFVGYQFDWAANAWQTVWSTSVSPGETDWWGVNPNPAWLDYGTPGAPWASTFESDLGSGASNNVELDLATNWNVCGGQGQIACPGGGCADETLMSDIGGRCVPITNKVFTCANQSTMNLYGNWSLTIANNGAWGFLGGIEATGGLVTNYGAGISLSATNASGQNYAFGQSGTVADHDNAWGTSIPSSNTFNETGIDPTVPGRWSEILHSSASCGISGSINLGDDLLAILGDTGIAVSAVGPVLLTGVLLTHEVDPTLRTTGTGG